VEQLTVFVLQLFFSGRHYYENEITSQWSDRPARNHAFMGGGSGRNAKDNSAETSRSRLAA
jgi:hypothetical protein